jgi:hypothetical protein
MERMRMGAAVAMMVLVWPAVCAAQVLADAEKVAKIVHHLDRQPDDKLVGCQVTPLPPVADFAFRLRAGYALKVPLDPYPGAGHGWMSLTQVTVENDSRPPVYLLDFNRLPEIPTKDMEWNGHSAFLVGEGRYQVKWVMLDDSGRVCRKQWKIDTQSRTEGRNIPSLLAPDTVADLSGHGMKLADHPPGEKVVPRLTILMDAAPLRLGPDAKSELSPRDRGILIETLYAVLENVRASSVRVVAFNLEQQKEIFRRDDFTTDSMIDLKRR